MNVIYYYFHSMNFVVWHVQNSVKIDTQPLQIRSLHNVLYRYLGTYTIGDLTIARIELLIPILIEFLS